MVEAADEGSPTARTFSGRLLTLALFALAAAIASALPLPWGLAALGFLMPAHVLAIRTLTAGFRAKVSMLQLAVAGLCLGIVWMLTLVGIGRALVYPVQYDYERCMLAAVTEQGRADCATDLQSDLRTYVDRLT